MNLKSAALLELIHMAPCPLYSAFRWLKGQPEGKELGWAEFSSLVEQLLDEGTLTLSQEDEGVAVAISAVPVDLPGRYEDVQHTDPSFDPFGYVLTLGPRAAHFHQPPITVDINFEEGTFVATARAGAIGEAIDIMQRLNPHHVFIATSRVDHAEMMHMEGIVRKVSGDARE